MFLFDIIGYNCDRGVRGFWVLEGCLAGKVEPAVEGGGVVCVP